MMDAQKEAYEKARSQIERTKQRIYRIVKDKGELAIMEQIPLKRLGNAGTPPVAASIVVALLHYYNYVTNSVTPHKIGANFRVRAEIRHHRCGKCVLGR